jgi:hypothetical protein
VDEFQAPLLRRVLQVDPRDEGRGERGHDEPAEKVDTKVVETLVALEPGARLPIGLRVDAFLVR